MFSSRLKKFLFPMTFLIGIGVIIGLLSFYPPASPVTDNDVTPVYSEQKYIRFAVIGDFGQSGDDEAQVAALVKSWNPDFIVTTGDNNYPNGSKLTIDKNIGQYYHEYIGAYSGGYGSGAEQSRFFPSIGNHDWHTITCLSQSCYGAYFGYFSLPGNERYYDFIWGPAHFFVLDSDPREPDGVSDDSIQGRWLKERLSLSSSPWNLVITHHPPYSSGQHGSNANMQWPYKQWGADVVISGHDHLYERILVDNLPYFVNGSGGGGLYQFNTPIPGSQIRFNQDYGAMLVEGDAQTLTFKYVTKMGDVLDEYILPLTSAN